ncbi:hypothetical protein F7725_025039 [Scomber scombrus]|uniref:Secreted protein n=1 Tax=Scomber scombrus TaxID=13677 RepID=A0AAV1MRE6_SCOSC
MSGLFGGVALLLLLRQRQAKSGGGATDLTINRHLYSRTRRSVGYTGRRLHGGRKTSPHGYFSLTSEGPADRGTVDKASTGREDNCISGCPMGTWDI